MIRRRRQAELTVKVVSDVQVDDLSAEKQVTKFLDSKPEIADSVLQQITRLQRSLLGLPPIKTSTLNNNGFNLNNGANNGIGHKNDKTTSASYDDSVLGAKTGGASVAKNKALSKEQKKKQKKERRKQEKKAKQEKKKQENDENDDENDDEDESGSDSE